MAVAGDVEENTAAAQKRAETLVRQLGDESFQAREKAADQLASMGIAASDALREGATSVDREVRYRCRRLLADIQSRQFNIMLERFLSSTGDDDEFTLPAWKRYKQRIGDSRAARLLFVEMQRAQPELLKAMDENLAQVSTMIFPRAKQVQESASRGTQLQLGDIAVLVFVGSDPDIEVNSQTYSYVSSLLHQDVVQRAMAGGVNKPLMAKLMGQWVLRAESTLAYQSLLLAMQYRLPEGIRAAQKTLQQANQAPHVKQYAILTIAKLGDRSHVPILEGLLTDSGLLQTRTINGKKTITQVRDVALAGCVHLSKHSLRDVGFEADAIESQQLIFNPSQLGFTDDQQRSKVFDKWRKLKASLKEKEAEGKSEAKDDEAKP